MKKTVNNKWGKRKSGSPVRGSSDVFKGSSLKVCYNIIMAQKGTVIYKDLTAFRHILKDTIVLFCRTVLLRCGIIVPLISNDCYRIIETNLTTRFNTNPHVASFVSCSLNFWNGIEPHIALINQSCSSCNSRRKPIALKHIQNDLKLMTTTYLDPILSKMETGYWSNVTADCIDQFRAAKISVAFLSSFFAAYFLGLLPRVVDINIFNAALAYDPTLTSLYEIDATGVQAILTDKKKRFTSIRIECAAFILSASFKVL